LRLNEGLLVIGAQAFRGCTSLRNVTVPSTVTELGMRAFCDCSSLIELRLNEGLQVIEGCAFEGCTSLRNFTLPSTVIELDYGAFCRCSSLIELRLNDGLQVIGARAFGRCTALRSVTIPSTVAELGARAFHKCSNLAEVQFNEGLKIGECAFLQCTALRSVTLPSTVSKLGALAFGHCSNLSEVILLGGERLLDQESLACGTFREEKRLLNQGALDEMLFVEDEDGDRLFAFRGCPLTAVKISVSWALSERMARLSPKCRVSIVDIIRNLPCVELLQDGNVLACFPVVRRATDDEAEDDYDTDVEEVDFGVTDTNLETARSLYRVLQLIAYHELKQSSILIELAMWKSRIDEIASAPRADCRVAIPDPAKSLIMECCGFAGFLEPAIECAYE